MQEHYPFTTPPLPYAYDALEPFIDARTMELHHDRHLKTYVDNLNAALKNYPEYQNFSLKQLLLYLDFLPASLQAKVKNNGGGVFNHIFYFSLLKNPAMEQPDNPLFMHIKEQFGSFGEFRQKFTASALSVFGSGYTWLVKTPYGQLRIINSANQDTPVSMNLCPILALDVWEHAYYLKHYNKRGDYISDWFHIINWEQANHYYSDLSGL